MQSLEYLLTHNFLCLMGTATSGGAGHLWMLSSPFPRPTFLWTCGRGPAYLGLAVPVNHLSNFIFRFIDDLLFTCSREIDSLENLFNYLNDNEFNLTFTGHMDPKSVSFLDVTVVGEDIRVTSKANRKPSAGNAESRFWASSSHNIPVGQNE